jgi:hypothetical protein
MQLLKAGSMGTPLVSTAGISNHCAHGCMSKPPSTYLLVCWSETDTQKSTLKQPLQVIHKVNVCVEHKPSDTWMPGLIERPYISGQTADLAQEDTGGTLST